MVRKWMFCHSLRHSWIHLFNTALEGSNTTLHNKVRSGAISGWSANGYFTGSSRHSARASLTGCLSPIDCSVWPVLVNIATSSCGERREVYGNALECANAVVMCMRGYKCCACSWKAEISLLCWCCLRMETILYAYIYIYVCNVALAKTLLATCTGIAPGSAPRQCTHLFICTGFR